METKNSAAWWNWWTFASPAQRQQQLDQLGKPAADHDFSRLPWLNLPLDLTERIVESAPAPAWARTVALVACGKAKRDAPAKAKDLYTSPLFRASRMYAERISGLDWYVISAKYGLVGAETQISPYDQTLIGMDRSAQLAWAQEVATALRDRHTPPSVFRMVILGGRHYYGFLQLRLQELGYTVELPLGSRGLGQRVQWLNRANVQQTEQPSRQL